MTYSLGIAQILYDLAEEPEYDERTDVERAADAERKDISEEIWAADLYDRRYD